MGYDRSSGYGREGYGYGSLYGPGRRPERDGRGDYGRYDEGNRGYRGRSDRDYDRDRYARDRDYDPEDRGFFERAGDEVRSWFGDDEAERRRREDDRYDERRSRAEGGDRGRGWSDERGPRSGRVSQSDYDAAFAASYGAFGAYPPGLYDRGGAQDRYRQDRNETRGRHDHDPHYREWRDRQMDTLDRDYDEYRRDNQSRFNSEFGSWRQNRQTQRDSLGRVKEHQEVVGSDGEHIGTVDHVRGDRILLTKTDKDAGGHHHSIPSAWIRNVGDKVEVSKTADEAQRAWREEQDQNEQGGLFGGNRDNDRDRGTTNLNRSFSGTY
ncbi:MAG: DUF2171 domain-containing protein [Sphingomonadaceae bacterium]|nr:DUF2171 domain-containing protein [Sphingomonadaceae bacterium]